MDKKIIDLSKTVYQICTEYPEAIEIMKEVGFDTIANPGMVNTAGRFMTIPKGATMKKINMDKIIEAFKNNGYYILGRE